MTSVFGKGCCFRSKKAREIIKKSFNYIINKDEGSYAAFRKRYLRMILREIDSIGVCNGEESVEEIVIDDVNDFSDELRKTMEKRMRVMTPEERTQFFTSLPIGSKEREIAFQLHMEMS